MRIVTFRTQLPIYIFLAICIILFGYLGPRILGQREEYVTVEMIASGDNWWETLPQAPNWLAYAFSVGDAEYSGRKKVAEILDIKVYEEDAKAVVWVKAKLLVLKGANQTFRFRQQSLDVGSLITIRPNNAKLSALVISIGGIQPPTNYRNLSVTVTLRSKFPWLADAIMVGDEVRDSHGNILAKIIEKSVEPSAETITTADGRLLVRMNPLLLDITLSMNLQVVERGGSYFFNQIQPVKVGTKLWIPLKTVALYEAYVSQIHEPQ